MKANRVHKNACAISISFSMPTANVSRYCVGELKYKPFNFVFGSPVLKDDIFVGVEFKVFAK